MPCRTDGSPTAGEIRAARREGRLQPEDFEAIVCALLSASPPDIAPHWLSSVLSAVDWKEAGVSRKDFDTWRARHQAADLLRRKREADERLLETLY